MAEQLREFLKSKETLIRRQEVLRRTGLSKSTLHDRIKAGAFPAPIQIGPRSVAWIESEVDAWIEACITASRSTTCNRVA